MNKLVSCTTTDLLDPYCYAFNVIHTHQIGPKPLKQVKWYTWTINDTWLDESSCLNLMFNRLMVGCITSIVIFILSFPLLVHKGKLKVIWYCNGVLLSYFHIDIYRKWKCFTLITWHLLGERDKHIKDLICLTKFSIFESWRH